MGENDEKDKGNLKSASNFPGRPPSAESPMHKLHFDCTDYSVVVKNRAPPPKSWRWEIYRAGRSNPIRRSTCYFHTMVAANKEGKEALKQLLNNISARPPQQE